MPQIIYGSSDDLIEIEGGLREELNIHDADGYICCSDGTLLKVEFNGEWIFSCVRQGMLVLEIIPPVGEDNKHENYTEAPGYSGIVVFSRALNWVSFSEKVAK